MKQDGFVARFAGQWEELERLLERLEPGARGAGAANRHEDAATLPRRYRLVTQNLALARSRGYSLGLIERLEGLAFRGHQQLYQRREPFARACVRYLAFEFPLRLRRARTRLLAAVVVFFGSTLAAGTVVGLQPHLVTALIEPAQVERLETMYDPAKGRIGRARASDDDFVMFGFYIRNNIGIGFQTFAGGLLFGLGTLAFLLFNGLHVGAAAGYLTASGLGVPFWSFVAGHSPPELTAIVVSGAAGLHVGWALIHPGPRTRVQALVRAARQAVRLLYGAAALFLLAALIEAYWSSRPTLAPELKYAVGIAGWSALGAYVALGGRGREHLVGRDE